MKILITSRHTEVPSQVRKSIEQKIEKVLKNIKEDVLEVHEAITAEKSRQAIEVKVLTKYTTFRCFEETHDLQMSIDKVLDVLGRQIRKNKKKFQVKRRKTKPEGFITTEIPEYSEEHFDLSEAEIIKSNRFAPKPMSIDEALMQLKLSHDQFIVFANSKTNEVNVLYNRHDGKIGLIEPEF